MIEFLICSTFTLGNVNVLETLLKNGASIDKRDNENNTALLYGLSSGNFIDLMVFWSMAIWYNFMRVQGIGK